MALPSVQTVVVVIVVVVFFSFFIFHYSRHSVAYIFAQCLQCVRRLECVSPLFLHDRPSAIILGSYVTEIEQSVADALIN